MLKKCFFALTLTAIFPLAAEISFNSLAGSVQTFWSDTNGLPSNRILDVLQDGTGYIWLASYDGLIRFDGETFTEFTEAEHGFTGISPRVLCEDAYSTLWIGTNSTGLYAYQNKTFKRYAEEDGLPNLSIRAIKFDKDNVLWVGTANGLARLEKSGRFVPILDERNKSLGIITFILPIKDRIYVGSNVQGITVIQNEKIVRLPYLDAIQDYTFSAAYFDSDNILWLGTKDGKIIKIKEEKDIEFIDAEYLKGMSINEFLRTVNGTLYAATNRGIVTIKKGKPEIFSEENGLPNNIVSCLCQDFEENLWVGMERGGVGKFSKGKFLDLTSAESLPPTAANSVLEDADKNIWIAKDDGIVCLKSSTLPSARARQIDALIEKLHAARVRQIREEADGTLFFATYSDNGLLIFRKDGSMQILSKKDGLPNNRVRFSYRSSDNLLWIGTTAGPAVYFDGKITPFTQEDGLPNLFILCAEESRSGKMWLGTDGGGTVVLTAGFLDGKPVIKTEHVFTKDDGVCGNIIFRIIEDTENHIWLCTSEGLTLYKDGGFYYANKAFGAGSVGVFNIVQDTMGNLWIVTAKDLLLVKTDVFVRAVLNGLPAEFLVRYNRLDGLTGQLAANAWAHVTAENTLFLPTLKGVAVCAPSYYVTNKHAPPVVIESIVLDGKDYDVTEKRMTIEAGIKRILFKFTALSFTIPQRVQFEYKLEGYDKEWRSCGTTREIAYTNLNPGNYVFKVRAANNDGIVNKSGSSAAIYKKPFFYQTIWFYLLLTCCIGSSIFFAVQLRFRNLQRRADELDRKVKEKTKELAGEKEKSDKLLRNTLPPSVIDELISTGTSKPKVYPAVTVLFADLVSFTEWSGGTAPEHIIAQLNTMFTQFDGIMDAFGCERIKTLGDGYLACCGLRGEKDHALRLVGAAVEMLRSFETLNKDNNSRFRIKIGIDSGAITGGIVGVHKYIFDIFGDTVNTAFRLESVTAPMACTVSMKTAALISGSYRLYKRPSRFLKGKGKVPCYYINYQNAEYTMEFKEVKDCYDRLAAAFKEDRFDECRALISRLEPTLLEPEMANEIAIIEKSMQQNRHRAMG